MLGMARSGKSSLVNNVVNNAYTPVYSKTTQASLYYMVVRIAGEQDSLLEIEDTFGSGDVGEVALTAENVAEVQIGEFFDFWWPSTKERTIRKQKELLTKFSKPDPNSIVQRSSDKPLSVYPPPTSGAFSPLTQNRMAFLIIFDANDEDSYKEAVRLYEGLIEYHQKKKDKMKPVINFVANKIDLDPTSDRFQSVIASAKGYCDFHGVPLRQVSALQYKGVKKLFRTIVQAVRAQQLLWMLDMGGTKLPDDDEAAGKCSIS